MNKFKQYILKKKYDKARPLYIVCYWYNYGVLRAAWSGKFDKDGNPLTIYYSDHNGEYESYSIVPWYHETTGQCICYSFNKEQAETVARNLRDGGYI